MTALVLILTGAAFAESDFKAYEGTKLEPPKVFFEQKGKGLDFFLLGQSFLDQGRLQDSVTLKWPKEHSGTKVTKAFLLWSGEVNFVDKAVKAIHVKAGGASKLVRAKYFKSTRSTGYLYNAVADVTSMLKSRPSKITLSELRSDPVGGSFSVAGFALIVIYRSDSEGEFKLQIMPGPWLLSPGERYHLELAPQNSPQLTKAGVLGGHGRKGNAGGNLINNRAITGGDDWRGSAGELWDIHVYDDILDNKMKGWIFTFDPILEWIFPAGVVTQYAL